MSRDSARRYIDHKFVCIKCKRVNETRVDTLKDLYHKARNPPIQDGHRRAFYYERNCVYCQTYNEVLWEESPGY